MKSLKTKTINLQGFSDDAIKTSPKIAFVFKQM